jgi:hypothetical protein
MASKRLNEALAQIVAAGPPAEAAGKVAALLTTEARDASLMAFVPLLGSWRVLQSTEFSALEKRVLVWLSAALTGMLVAGIFLYAPTTSSTEILRDRIHSEVWHSIGSSRTSVPSTEGRRTPRSFVTPWTRRTYPSSTPGAGRIFITVVSDQAT